MAGTGIMVDWCDLPWDILRCVASRLELVDQIQFRAVCKGWSNITDVKPDDKLPWIFALDESRFRVMNGKDKKPHYYLYNLRHQQLYPVSIQRPITRNFLQGLESQHVMCIKFGWLLLNPSFRHSFCFFNPLTQKVINLPKLQLPKRFLPLSTFIYSPNSDTFVVYVTNQWDTRGVIIIKRWKSGDRKWESYDFVAEFPYFMSNIVKIEVVGESLFFVFDTGVVGSFNDRNKSWSVVVKPSADDTLLSMVDYLFHLYGHVFEFKGQLWILYLRPNRIYIFWRLDQSERRWVEVVQFHKCAIFCSRFNPHSILCSEQFVVASDTVANRIYYFEISNHSVSTIDFNRGRKMHVYPDPFRIKNVEFPWCRRGQYFLPYHWIEPCPF